jgi:hypothetical protein
MLKQENHGHSNSKMPVKSWKTRKGTNSTDVSKITPTLFSSGAFSDVIIYYNLQINVNTILKKTQISRCNESKLLHYAMCRKIQYYNRFTDISLENNRHKTCLHSSNRRSLLSEFEL